jgi:hypothetical protein
MHGCARHADDVDSVESFFIFFRSTTTSLGDILLSGESLEQSKPNPNIGERKSFMLQEEEEACFSSCSSRTEASLVGNASRTEEPIA